MFFYCFPYSITFNVFAIDEESTSDDDSIIEGDEAVESEYESGADKVIDEFEKLEYWSKRHVLHYQPRLLPGHFWAAYLCSPHSAVIHHASDPTQL